MGLLSQNELAEAFSILVFMENGTKVERVCFVLWTQTNFTFDPTLKLRHVAFLLLFSKMETIRVMH